MPSTPGWFQTPRSSLRLSFKWADPVAFTPAPSTLPSTLLQSPGVKETSAETKELVLLEVAPLLRIRKILILPPLPLLRYNVHFCRGSCAPAASIGLVLPAQALIQLLCYKCRKSQSIKVKNCKNSPDNYSLLLPATPVFYGK